MLIVTLFGLGDYLNQRFGEDFNLILHDEDESLSLSRSTFGFWVFLGCDDLFSLNRGVQNK